MDLVALIPVTHNNAILQRNEIGFQPLINQGFPLKALANMLINQTGQADGQNAVISNAGETAIPDICAHVQYLRTRLAEGINLNLEDEAVRAWIGVMAIIATSEINKDFKLDVQSINLNGSGIMKSVYRSALSNEHLLDNRGCLKILRLNGNPIAVLEPTEVQTNILFRCFCYPFSTIEDPAGCMTPVSWFRAGGIDSQTGNRIAHRWKNVLEKDSATNLPYLEKAQRGAFVEWLNALNHSGRIHYPEAVKKVITELNTDLTDENGQLLALENTFFNPTFCRPANQTAWRGALACIALSKMRGYSIELERYCPNPAGDPLREILLWNVPERMNVKVNGVAIGYLDPEVLIRPFYYVTQELRQVPWFRNQEWVEIPGNFVPLNEMDNTERRKLAYWYNTVAGNMNQAPQTQTALQNSCAQLVQACNGVALPSNNSQIDALNRNTLNDGTVINTAFTVVMKQISNVPDFTYPMPPDNEIFTDVLVLTMASYFDVNSRLGIVGDTGIENSVNISDNSNPQDPRTERFLALLPLRQSFTDLFEEGANGGFGLTSLSMVQDNASVVVTITLNNGGAPVVRQKIYSAVKHEILYYQSFPYLAMWPYIRSNSWKKYYISWCQWLECNTPSRIYVNSEQNPLVPVHDYEESSTYAKDTADFKPEDRWWSLIYDRFPEYIHLKVLDGGAPMEVGAVYVKPPQIHNIAGGNTFYAAIDFGSSNTIVRLTDGSGTKQFDMPNTDYRVFTNDFVKPLTMCANELPGYYSDIKDFHEFTWLPFVGQADRGEAFWDPDPSARTDHLPTVVELYKGVSAENNEAPRFGQFLHSNCNVMTHFLRMQQMTNKSIEDIGIRSNIKMRRDGDQFVGQIAIEMILLECALAATTRDAMLSFVISYPDQQMWKNLQPLWTMAALNAKNTCDSISYNNSNLLKVTELMASRFYASYFLGNVNPEAGYCILDIGGGTSDISLWRNYQGQEVIYGGLSLKYAGNQITSESIFSFYRAIVGAQAPNIQDFRKLWNLTDAPAAIRQYEEKMEYGFDQLVGLDLTVADHLRSVRNQVPILATTLVSDYKFSGNVAVNNLPVEPFVALLRFKVGGVFYIIARFIEMTDACNMNNPDVPYDVCLAGNGAAALDACGPEMKDFLIWLMQSVLGDRRFDIENQPKYRKTEVVNGMCEMLSMAQVGNGQVNLNGLPQDMKDMLNMAESDFTLSDIEIEMFNSYCFYVEYIVGAQQDFFSLGNLFAGNGVTGPSIHSIYQMLTMQEEGSPWELYPWQEGFWDQERVNQKNFGIFMARKDHVLRDVMDEVETGTPLRLVAHIAAIKMADYMLLVHKFK